MQIDINRIAKLARLVMDEQQAQKFSRQMNDILTMVDNLPELEGGAIGLDPENPMRLRADTTQPSTRREDILRNAPQVEAGCIVVPRVIE
jgi:aspartyl-tRNA(Asn)/glutamyl-tRNA(Gln) amidotransferase subunit C